MTRELKRVDVYQLFLSKVFGCGPVVSSYLIAMIRTDRLNKVSNLRRYCGYACDESGRLERRSGGPKFDPQGVRTEGTGTFNDDLRRCIWQMFSAMWKNAAKKSEKAPYGSTTKYLTRWREAKAGALAVGMPKGKAHSKGMHKAADLFIEDLYTVLCALTGLPVWPSWYAMKLGFYHGGKVCVNQPKMLSVEEAITLVGNVGSTPLAKPAGDEEDEVEEEVAAE
jgi:hypothetical protein